MQNHNFTNLMNLYRAELKGAIRRYQAANAPINSHRTADIVALEKHLKNTDLSPEKLREKFNECFAKFRTGLKLFNTWLHETCIFHSFRHPIPRIPPPLKNDF